MASVDEAAARALAVGDPLRALGIVARRGDAVGIALRGIALAQLGELGDAVRLLRRAAKLFGIARPVALARTWVALAEIDLAARDLRVDEAQLASAIEVLCAAGDIVNARHARLVQARRFVLVGALVPADEVLDELRKAGGPPAFVAQRELVAAERFLRDDRAREAGAALAGAAAGANAAGHVVLAREIALALRGLGVPMARYLSAGTERTMTAHEVEVLAASPTLVIDARRRALRQGPRAVPLASRPVLFTLLRALGEASPAGVARGDLVRHAFGATRPNDSHRARLRVEMGRLRAAIRELATISATPTGFVLVPLRSPRPIGVLAPLLALDDERAAILALLRDGLAWSSSALARALGQSQRTTQRALASLADLGRIDGLGAASARRWRLAPLLSLAPPMLLTPPLTER